LAGVWLSICSSTHKGSSCSSITPATHFAVQVSCAVFCYTSPMNWAARRRFIILPVIVVLIAGGIYSYVQIRQANQPAIINPTTQATSTIQTPNPKPTEPPPLNTENPPQPAPVTQCVPPFVFPPAPNGGMTYVNWHFNTPDIHALQFHVKIENNPGTKSDLFLQLYDGSIDGSGQYFGLQTTGLVLFSRFGTASPEDASVPSGSTLALDGNPNNGEGSTYISVRRNFGSLPSGTYSVRMTRDTYDGTGDWFKYYVTFPNASEQYIGAIRFPRATTSVPASFHDDGGTWTEFWDNNSTTLFPVPLWHVRTSIIANGGSAPRTATSNYSAMPNSDVYLETDGSVSHVFGGCTQRIHPPGLLK